MPTAPERAWQQIEEVELAVPGVTAGTGFGRNAGLRIAGRIFAIRTADAVVVKLPASRADELVTAGIAEPWGPGSRIMKEWVAIPDADRSSWPGLVAESRAFVAS